MTAESDRLKKMCFRLRRQWPEARVLSRPHGDGFLEFFHVPKQMTLEFYTRELSMPYRSITFYRHSDNGHWNFRFFQNAKEAESRRISRYWR